MMKDRQNKPEFVKSNITSPKARKWFFFILLILLLGFFLWGIASYFFFYPVEADAHFQNIGIMANQKGRPTISVSGVLIKWALVGDPPDLHLPPHVVVAPPQQTFSIQTDMFGQINNIAEIIEQINHITPPDFRNQVRNFLTHLRFSTWALGQFQVNIQYNVGVVRILSLPRLAHGTLQVPPICKENAQKVYCQYLASGANFVRFSEPDPSDIQNMIRLFPTNVVPQVPGIISHTHVINFGFAPGVCGGGGCNPIYLHTFNSTCQ